MKTPKTNENFTIKILFASEKRKNKARFKMLFKAFYIKMTTKKKVLFYFQLAFDRESEFHCPPNTRFNTT